MSTKQNSNANLDLQLWIQMKGGSEFALNKLVKQYFNVLLNYGFKFVKDEDFIKDCVQEVFIEVWKRREKVAVPDSVKAYLFSSVRKKVVREGFRQQIMKVDEELDYENNSSLSEHSFEWTMIQQESDFEINEKVKKALNALSKRQREVIYLQYYQNLSREEISKIMDINTQSVSNLIQVAFKSFKENWIQILILWSNLYFLL
ncbi:MAG: sigma-70 family RNA polymerase sigma factor [Arcicella sp.]|jgi:RNA polymerase sigma factor (sigma-70 family)|nr:sigma-70 family RNA polymerase sigma factor [Arcicella sp.]